MITDPRILQQAQSYLNKEEDEVASQEAAPAPVAEEKEGPGFFKGISNAPKHASQAMHSSASMLGEIVSDMANDPDTSRYHRMKAWNNIQKKQELEKDMGTAAHLVSGGIQSLPSIAGYAVAGPVGAGLVGAAQTAGDIKSQAQEEGIEVSNAKALGAGGAAGLVDATIGRFLPTGLNPTKQVLSDAIGAAGSGAQQQVWQNLALNKPWSENTGTAAIAGGAMGGGLSGLNAAMKIPLNKGGEKSITTLREIDDAPNDLKTSETFRTDVFEHANSDFEFDEKIKAATTYEDAAEAIEVKLNNDVANGAPAALAKAMKIGTNIPFTGAGFRFDLENIDKSKSYGNAGENFGLSSKKQEEIAKKNEQDKATGFRVGAAQRKGFTPESHKEKVYKEGTAAFEKAVGVFHNNATKAFEFKERAKHSGVKGEDLTKYNDLVAYMKKLESDASDISKGQADIGESAVINARRAYNLAAELGMLKEFKGLDGEAWSPILDIQATQLLERAIVSEYKSFHHATPDMAKEVKSPFKMGLLDWGLVGTANFGALAAKKAAESVIDVGIGASRKRGFKNRVEEGDKLSQDIIGFAKGPKPGEPKPPTTPPPSDTPPPTPPPVDTPPSGPPRKDFDEAAEAGDLDGMAQAAEADVKKSLFRRLTGSVFSRKPEPATLEVAEEVVETPAPAPAPERTSKLSPDRIKQEETTEIGRDYDEEVAPAVTAETEEAPGFIRKTHMDAMSPKELNAKADKLEAEVDGAKDELIQKQSEGIEVTAQELAAVQRHFKKLQENAKEAREIADLKERQEAEEKAAAEKEKQEGIIAKLKAKFEKTKGASSSMKKTPAKPASKSAEKKEEPKPASKPSYTRSEDSKATKKPSQPKPQEEVVVEEPQTQAASAPPSSPPTPPKDFTRQSERVSPKKPSESEEKETESVAAEPKVEDNVEPVNFRRETDGVSPKKPEAQKQEELSEEEPFVEDGEVVSEQEFIKTSAAVPPVTKVWTDTIEEVEKIPLLSREPAQVVEYKKAKANMKKIDETLNSVAEETPEDREILEALMHSKQLSIEDPNFRKKLKNAAKEYREAQATQGANKVKGIIEQISSNVKKRVGADLYAIEDSMKKFVDKYKKDADKPKSDGSKKDPKPELTEEEIKNLVKESVDAVDEFVAAYDIPEPIVKEAYMSEGIIKGKDMFDPVKLNKVIARLNTAKKKEDAKKALQDAASKKKEDLSAEKADKENEILQKKRDIRDAQIELSNLKTALASKKVSAENKTKISDKIISLENDLKKMNDELGNLNYGLELVEERNKKLISDYEESVKAAEDARLEAEAAKKAEENLDIVMSQAEDIKKRMVDKGFPSVMADDFIERQFAYKKTPLTDKEMNAIFQKAMNEVKKEHEEFLKLRQEYLKKKEEATQSSEERQTVAQEETKEAIEDADPEVIKGLSEEVLKQIHTAFNQSKEEYDTLKAMLDTIDSMKAEVKEKIGNKETKTLSAFKKAMEEVETLSKQYPDDRRMWLTEGTYQKLLNTITGDDLDKTWYGRAAISLRAAAYGVYGPTPSHGVLSLDSIKKLAKEKGLPAPKLKSEVDPIDTIVEEVSEILTKTGQTVKVKKTKAPKKKATSKKEANPDQGSSDFSDNAEVPKEASTVSEATPATSSPSSKIRMGKLIGEVIPTKPISSVKGNVVPTTKRIAEEMKKRQKKTYSKKDLDRKGKEAFIDLDTSGNVEDAVRYLEAKALRNRTDFPEDSPVTALVDMIDLDNPDYFSTGRMDSLQSMGYKALQKIAGYTRSDYKKKALDTLRENIRVQLDFVKKLKEALPELRKAAEEGSPNSRKRVKAVADYLKAVADVNRMDAYDKLGEELIAHAESLATPAKTASKAKSAESVETKPKAEPVLEKGALFGEELPKGAMTREELDDKAAKEEAKKRSAASEERASKYPPVLVRLKSEDALKEFDDLISEGMSRADAIKEVLQIYS